MFLLFPTQSCFLDFTFAQIDALSEKNRVFKNPGRHIR
jgi:hypothetical protein